MKRTYVIDIPVSEDEFLSIPLIIKTEFGDEYIRHCIDSAVQKRLEYLNKEFTLSDLFSFFKKESEKFRTVNINGYQFLTDDFIENSDKIDYKILTLKDWINLKEKQSKMEFLE